MEPFRVPQTAPRKGYGGHRGYSGPGIIQTVREEQRALEAFFGRRIFGGRASISVGGGSVPVLFPGNRVFAIPPTAPGVAPPSVPPPIDRRDKPQDTGLVQMQIVNDWFTYHELKAQGIPVQHASQVPPAPAPVPVAPTPTTLVSQDTDMDLGTLATDLLRQAGTAYIQRELGTPVGYAQAPTIQPAVDFDIPFVDIIPQQPGAPATGQCSHGPSPVYKKVCGEYKWVTPKRRRRKALVTQTDLKGLAALKGVLGQGKILETWIATHS